MRNLRGAMKELFELKANFTGSESPSPSLRRPDRAGDLVEEKLKEKGVVWKERERRRTH